jgi:hypothetical protein
MNMTDFINLSLKSRIDGFRSKFHAAGQCKKKKEEEDGNHQLKIYENDQQDATV